MKEIQLARGKGIAQVDDDDFERLNQFKWCNDGHGYAQRNLPRAPGKHVGMHREILHAPDTVDVDHINGNRLDNRKENLRLCSRSQNKANAGSYSTNTSGFKGVTWHKRVEKWQAQITVNYHNKSLGYFDDPIAAARAYDKAAIEHFGPFARVNIPSEAA